MKFTILLSVTFASLLMFSGFSQGYNHANLKIKSSGLSDPMAESKPEYFDLSYSFKNLRLFPIMANESFVEGNKDIGKFTLLKDAIEQKKIVITETGARHLADTTNAANNPSRPNSNGLQNINGSVGGTVNTLFAQNNSTDTIFVMAGEVVKGGKQDRVIGQDVVLAPGENIDISAFCVEKSRWTTKDNNGGEFTGYYNVSSMDIRKAVTEQKDQSEVWNKVDEHTSKNGASSETKTYTNLANSEEYQKQVAEYLEKFKSSFKGDQKVIGVIAVTGNKVMGLDLFATHDLFIQSYSNLIHSYVGNAITQGSEITISNEEVFDYLDKILKSEEGQNEAIDDNGTFYEYQNKKLHITTYD